MSDRLIKLACIGLSELEYACNRGNGSTNPNMVNNVNKVHHVEAAGFPGPGARRASSAASSQLARPPKGGAAGRGSARTRCSSRTRRRSRPTRASRLMRGIVLACCCVVLLTNAATGIPHSAVGQRRRRLRARLLRRCLLWPRRQLLAFEERGALGACRQAGLGAEA